MAKKRKSKEETHAEVLEWVRKHKTHVTAAWSAYSAAKAGVEWDDWLAARGFENVD